MSSNRTILFFITVLLISLISFSSVYAGDIDPLLLKKMEEASIMEKIPVIIYLKDQVDLDQMEEVLKMSVPYGERVPVDFRYKTIITALMNIAEESQPAVLNSMEQYKTNGDLTDIQKFWIRNIIVAKATSGTILEMSKWENIGTIYYDGLLAYDKPVDAKPGEAMPEGVEPGLRAINAHKLWEVGITGQGRIVMGMDTGVNGNNTAFNNRWRGTLPGIKPTWAWHDPSSNTTFPIDGDAADNHGTHTMGTMCGRYPNGDTLGVAPDAFWIASNSLMGGSPHTSRSIYGFQWAANPDSNINTMNDVPDVISNSWFDPNVEGTQCETNSGGYGPVIQAVEALGTAVVFSAGNSGSAASTITAPKNRARTATDIYAVGAVDGNTAGYPIASFSSRGPTKCTTVPDSLKIKPEVSAPGVNVRSAFQTSGYRTLSGTSMASPHVAGAITLLRQAAPFMTGTELKYLLMRTATDLGTAGEDNTFGWGIIDVWRAYQSLPLNAGFVKGVVTTAGNPLQGVLVDFVDNVQQLPATTGSNGAFKVMARVDTPLTSANYTLRAQKFGFNTVTENVTVVVGDTITKNFSMTRVNYPLITLSKNQIAFSTTPVYGTKRDSLMIRSEGGINLNVSSITSTHPRFTVIPSSAIISSGDSLKVFVTYAPLLDGPDTGRVIILSNANNSTRNDVVLTGTGLGAPIFTSNVSSLSKTLEGGTKDSISFRVKNQGTAVGNFAARAVMYRRNEIVQEFSMPLTFNSTEKTKRILLVIDNPGLDKTQSDFEKGPDTGTPVEGTSSSLIYRGLVEAGFFVDTIPFATHNPATYADYDLVIWASGANSATPTFNDAAKRAALVSRVRGGGKVWVEGGEVGYHYRKSGTTTDLDPPFRRIVLRDSNWISDVSTSNLVITQPSHAIFSTPNQINGPVIISSTSIYARDAMRLQPNGGGIKLAGWSAHTVQGPDTAAFIVSEDNGLPLTVFTPFAFGGMADTNVAKRLAQNISTWLVGAGAQWLSVNPKSGSLAIGDSTILTAVFDATDPIIYNEPGNYYGRVQITATNSAIADSLNIPANLFVIPPVGPRLSVSPDSIYFGSVKVGDLKTLPVTLRNIGGSPLSVSNINISHPSFSVVQTSFVIQSLDSLKLNITFTAPSPEASYSGILNFVSNDPSAPNVRLGGFSIGAPKYVARLDSLVKSIEGGQRDSILFYVRNNGSKIGNFAASVIMIPREIQGEAVEEISVEIEPVDVTENTELFSWLTAAPGSGTIAINDSILMVAYFNATDPTIFNNPGNYFGRVEVRATNSTLADTLRLPVRMYVVPPAGARIVVTPNNLSFGNVDIGSNKLLSVLVRNIGASALNVTNITASNTNYTATPTSFSLAFNDTQRVTVRFTPPFPPGAQTGNLNFISNDPIPPLVPLTGQGVGTARIAVMPDSLAFHLNPTSDTTYAAFKIKNSGTDTLRYIIDEALASEKFASSIGRSITQQSIIEYPKGSNSANIDPPMTDGRGGPDAGGYVWRDSDEQDGPTYNWFDISTVGTQLTGWVGSTGAANLDDGYVKFRLPFAFRYYGVNYDSLKVVTNGWVSFDVVSTTTQHSNGAIPTTVVPNNALYPWWDDLDLRTSGAVYRYHDVANNRFIVQFTNVPAYVSSGPPPGVYTFQIVIKTNGEIFYYYKDMQGVLNSATIGIENSSGTIALQVINNQTYIKNNLAVLFTRDMLSWVAVANNMGTVVPGDSQTVQLRIHPAGLGIGVYNGRLVVSGNSPDVKQVALRMQIVSPPVTGWTLQTSFASTSIHSVKAVSGSVAWACGKGGKVFRTTNSGTSWDLVTNPSTLDNYNIEALDANTAFVLSNGSDDARIYRTTNGGTNWTMVYQSTSSGTFLNAIKMFDSNNGYAQGDPVGSPLKYLLLRTTNGGANWTSAADLAPASSSEYGFNNGMYWHNNQTGWFGTNNFRVYRTTTGGETWTPATTTMGQIVSLWFKDALSGFAGTDNGLAKSTNGGLTWSLISSPVNITSNIAGITDKVWSTHNLNIVHSTNFGTDWTTQYSGTGGQQWTDISFVNTGSTIHGWGVSINGHIAKYYEVISDIRTDESIPAEFRVYQNYPNPFNPTTTIKFTVGKVEHATLTVYNLLGQEVAKLFDETAEPGRFYEITLDGSKLGTGVYFYKLATPSHSEIKRMILMK